jgi:RNA polymerase sigma-70 factor, ECF subfamily
MNYNTPTHREFNALINPHLKSLKNTAYRLTRSEEEADDLMQETFFKSFKAFGQYERNTNFRAWIFKIMVNSYITAYRKMVRRPQKVSYDDLEDYHFYQNDAFNTETANVMTPGFTDDHFEDEVKGALEKLPYYFRIIVLLCDVEGFSYQEISNIINIPVGTVMSRLHRGRSLLRRRLTKYAQQKGYVPAFG